MAKQAKTWRNNMARALDRKSWTFVEKLSDSDFAFQLENAVAEGATPEEIREFVGKHCSAYDGDFAALAESAARYLGGQQVEA